MESLSNNGLATKITEGKGNAEKKLSGQINYEQQSKKKDRMMLGKNDGIFPCQGREAGVAIADGLLQQYGLTKIGRGEGWGWAIGLGAPGVHRVCREIKGTGEALMGKHDYGFICLHVVL